MIRQPLTTVRTIGFGFAAAAVVGLVAGCAYRATATTSTGLPSTRSTASRPAATEGRVRLNGPGEFFVSPAGSDDADGLTPATPWHTLQHAYDFVSQHYDLTGYPTTIHLADGTYGEENGKDNVVFCDGRIVGQVGPIRFVGNAAHPEKVVLSATSNNIFEIIATWAYVEGVTLTGTGSTVGMLSYFDARITFADVVFGPMGEGIHMSACGGIIMPFSDYKITGGAGYHMLAQTPGSRIHIDGRTITLANNPKFSAFFAMSQDLAMISAYNDKFVGTPATGTRYLVRTNSIIKTGGGPDYFPGDAAGSAATGGRYGP